MNIKKLIKGLAFSMLLNSELAMATDGKKLLAACQTVINYIDSGETSLDHSSGVDIGLCLGMAEGVRNTMIIYSLSDLPQDSYYRVCLPEGGIKNGQAARIISSYLMKNPAKLHIDASGLAMFAFIDAYPCK